MGGAFAPEGLARASEFFGRAEYPRTAEESADFYYRENLSKGYTTGGPGDILRGVESESAFGLLESFVVLYEVTAKEHCLPARGNAPITAAAGLKQAIF